MRCSSISARAAGWAVCAAIWVQACFGVPLGAPMLADIGFGAAALCSPHGTRAASPAPGDRSGPAPTQHGTHDHGQCLMCSAPGAAATAAAPIPAVPDTPVTAEPRVPPDRTPERAGAAPYVSRAPPLNA
jgi:hypothetical protein